MGVGKRQQDVEAGFVVDLDEDQGPVRREQADHAWQGTNLASLDVHLHERTVETLCGDELVKPRRTYGLSAGPMRRDDMSNR